MKKNILKSVPIGYGRFTRMIIMIAVPKKAKGKRAVAILHLKKLQAIGEFQKKMKLIREDMKLNAAAFPAPPVPVADNGTFDTDIKDLDAAETKALTKETGTATTRDVAQQTVLDDAHALQGYVQLLADKLHDTQKAVALIQLSGFDVSIREYHSKSDFTAKNTKISGTVKLAINVKKATGSENIRYSVNWQMSTDEKEWDDLPETLKGSTLVPDLTPGIWMWFRFMVVLKDGEHGWSQAVKLLVT